jgi:hypothetical protein
MKLEKLLLELEAEISGDDKGNLGIKKNRVFANGNLIDTNKLKDGSEWQKVFKEIIDAIKTAKLEDKFKTDDIKDLDITGANPRGLLTISAEDGTQYVYNALTHKLKEMSFPSKERKNLK